MTAAFEVNNCITMCFNELGCGEAALRKFSAIMGMPGLAHKTYRRLSKKVSDAHAEVTSDVLTAAVAAVHRAYGDASDGGADPVADSDNDGENSDNDSDENPVIGFDRDATLGENSVSSASDGDDDGDDRGGAGAIADVGGGANDDDNRGAANVGGVDERGDGTNDDDDIVDVTVSFDGTWHKRGFTSNYGVATVIDVVTGLVLDHIVL